jgi:hypothetical protein
LAILILKPLFYIGKLFSLIIFFLAEQAVVYCNYPLLAEAFFSRGLFLTNSAVYKINGKFWELQRHI